MKQLIVYLAVESDIDQKAAEFCLKDKITQLHIYRNYEDALTALQNTTENRKNVALLCNAHLRKDTLSNFNPRTIEDEPWGLKLAKMAYTKLLATYIGCYYSRTEDDGLFEHRVYRYDATNNDENCTWAVKDCSDFSKGFLFLIDNSEYKNSEEIPKEVLKDGKDWGYLLKHLYHKRAKEKSLSRTKTRYGNSTSL